MKSLNLKHFTTSAKCFIEGIEFQYVVVSPTLDQRNASRWEALRVVWVDLGNKVVRPANADREWAFASLIFVPVDSDVVVHASLSGVLVASPVLFQPVDQLEDQFNRESVSGQVHRRTTAIVVELDGVNSSLAIAIDG